MMSSLKEHGSILTCNNAVFPLTLASNTGSDNLEVVLKSTERPSTVT